MREFTTAVKKDVKKKSGERESVEFKQDGEVLKAFKPDDDQFALLLAAVGLGSSGTDGVAGTINFLLSVLDSKSKSYVSARLLDHNDEFGMEEVQQIMFGLIEEWSGRPTESSTDSAESPQTDGRKSTQSTSTSISSESALIGS